MGESNKAPRGCGRLYVSRYVLRQVYVGEPTVVDTVSILRGIKERLRSN